MTVFQRADWGARAPKSTTGMGKVSGVGGHWEGVPLGAYRHDECVGKLKQIQDFHMNRNGWADIAYSMMVCRHGGVYVGRGPGKRSAANGTNDANARYYAICILMGPGDSLTDEAKRGFLEAREYLMRNGAGPEIRPHRSFLATQCPGDEITNWIAQGCPAPGGAPTPPPAPPAPTPTPPVNDPYSVEAQVAALPVIRQGSNGQHVRIMQGLLIANGRTVAVDGAFGPGTAAALREWQGAAGLGADGICGPVTWRRLLCI